MNHDHDFMTFSERGILVKLTISEWSASKTDKNVSSEVIVQHGATQIAGKFQKKLLLCTALAQFKTNAQNARQMHYSLTAPWLDEGFRILPAKMWRKYNEQMEPFKHQAYVRTEEFCRQYAAAVEEAKSLLGTMWNANDYPPIEKIRPKFCLTITPRPVPSANDWRIDMDKKTMQEFKDQSDAAILTAARMGLHELYTRVEEKVEHLFAILDDSNRIIQHRMVDKYEELVQLVPDLNLTGEPNLNNVVLDLSSLTSKLDVNAIRDDNDLRAALAKEAKALLDKVKKHGATYREE